MFTKFKIFGFESNSSVEIILIFGWKNNVYHKLRSKRELTFENDSVPKFEKLIFFLK